MPGAPGYIPRLFQEFDDSEDCTAMTRPTSLAPATIVQQPSQGQPKLVPVPARNR